MEQKIPEQLQEEIRDIKKIIDMGRKKFSAKMQHSQTSGVKLENGQQI